MKNFDAVRAGIAILLGAIFVLISLFYGNPVHADQLVEMSIKDDDSEVVLTNAPCTAALPVSVSSHVPKGAVLFRTYAIAPDGIHEGCWMSATPAKTDEADAISKGGKLIRLVNVFTDEGFIFTVPLERFTPRKTETKDSF